MSLRCIACGYENDPTRVYCHSCGLRLERTAAAPTGFTPPEETQKVRRKRSGGIPWRAAFAALVRLVVMVAVLAGIALAFWPPVDVPAPVAADEQWAGRLNSLIATAASGPGGVAFSLPADDVNKWFATAIKPAANSDDFRLRPERVYGVPCDGTLRVGVQAALPLAGRIYFEGDYMPVREAGGYSLAARRYSVGRLTIPVALGWPVARQMDAMAGALEPVLGGLARASDIELTPQAVKLRWSDKGR